MNIYRAPVLAGREYAMSQITNLTYANNRNRRCYIYSSESWNKWSDFHVWFQPRVKQYLKWAWGHTYDFDFFGIIRGNRAERLLEIYKCSITCDKPVNLSAKQVDKSSCDIERFTCRDLLNTLFFASYSVIVCQYT